MTWLLFILLAQERVNLGDAIQALQAEPQMQARVVAHHVSLEWNASTTAGSKYFVYRRRRVIPTFTKLNSAAIAGETYTDTTVTAGHTYIYQITAEVNGLEGAPSNQVSVAIR